MDSSRITYAGLTNTTLETEISALANVYKYVLDCRAKKEATRPGGPEDPERISDEIRAKTSIP